jgi:uncharacterized protein (DUF488 family)
MARASNGSGVKTPTPKRRGNPVVWTIGHSTRTLEDFLQLLQAHCVTRVVDVRTIPRSRFNPQFNKETLPKSLKAAGIAYCHMPGLGGLRHAKADSLNQGWRNPSFRGFADYMQTAQMHDNLKKLLVVVKKDRVALMCAEAVPWRCHRSLLADALLIRGIRVEHIMSGRITRPHLLTPGARVKGRQIIYPQETPRERKTLKARKKQASRRVN